MNNTCDNSRQIEYSMIHLKIILILCSLSFAQDFLIPSQKAYTSRDALIKPEVSKRNQQIHQKFFLKYSWDWCSGRASTIDENLPTDELSQSAQPDFCKNNANIQFKDSSQSFSFRPIIEEEYRLIDIHDDKVISTNYGGTILGHIDYLSFWVDARIFSESHDKQDGLNRGELSWDREFIDVQDEDNDNLSNNLSFVSYARYRAAMTLDTRVGKLGFRRETIHWGPGVFLNLSFNYQAVPFNHVFYQGEIGPVRVWTLYGKLSRSTGGYYQRGRDNKTIYAHRYEWSVMPNLTLGMTEQLILFNQDEPWAFVPIVPLFMEKGQGVEEDNNGNMAFDITYKLPGWALLYTEFLLDDMQEPSSLFDNFWGNRWAWMAGLHLSHKTHKNLGLIAEYSRVEPWVYTHYDSLTAQSTNGGAALGNPYGPNSQAVVVSPYYKIANHWSIGAKALWLWKGDDAGSDLQDGTEERLGVEKAGLIEPNLKRFLHNVNGPQISVGPQIYWRGYGLQIDLEASWGSNNDQIITRIAYQY